VSEIERGGPTPPSIRTLTLSRLRVWPRYKALNLERSTQRDMRHDMLVSFPHCILLKGRGSLKGGPENRRYRVIGITTPGPLGHIIIWVLPK
jgi:hypothetical protein